MDDRKQKEYLEKRNALFKEQKERFGRSFDRATMWYGLLHKKSIGKFTEDDFRLCYYQWNLMQSLNSMVGTVELEDGSNNEVLQLESKYIDKTFVTMQKVFNIDSPVTSEQDKIDFINSCLARFNQSTKTEVLHKASIKVIKMSFEDLENLGSGYVFDSRKCGTGNMRYILTSEDGISRLLSDLGKDQVILNLNTANLENGTPEDAERYRLMKEEIFFHGITDIATGKKFLSSAPSASSTRHVDFPFVHANDPQEIYDIWCAITGFSSLEELARNIGHVKEDGIWLNFAKTKARIAQNGANSLPVANSATERVRNRLRNARVDFVPDCTGTVDTPYKKIISTGILGMEMPDGSKIEERVK